VRQDEIDVTEKKMVIVRTDKVKRWWERTDEGHKLKEAGEGQIELKEVIIIRKKYWK